MNQQPDQDWIELARLWQAESVGISVEDIERHMRRERAQLRALALLELAGLALGAAFALWLALRTPEVWMSGIMFLFCVLSFWFGRKHSELDAGPSGTATLLTSLRISAEREERVAEKLRFGRAMSYAVLMIMVIFLSRHLHGAPAWKLVSIGWPLIGAAWIVAVLAWNFRLMRRSNRRRRRLQEIAAILGKET
jgi:hypothetical protein